MTPDELQLLEDIRPLLTAWIIEREVEAAIGPLPRETVTIDRDGLDAWFAWIRRMMEEGKMPSKTPKQHRAMEAAAAGKSNLGIPQKVGKEFVQADKAAPHNLPKGRGQGRPTGSARKR